MAENQKSVRQIPGAAGMDEQVFGSALGCFSLAVY